MVNKSFQRVDELERHIKNARLPYEAWKVLFTIDKQMTSEQIADLLEEEAQVVNNALERLLQEKLVITVEGETETVMPQEEEQEAPLPPEKEEAPEPSKTEAEVEGAAAAEALISAEEILKEEPPAEESPAVEEAAKQVEESAEPLVEELIEETATEAEQSLVTEEEELPPEVSEQIGEETAVSEQETAAEEPAAESEIEININEEENTETLDLDFKTEEAEAPAVTAEAPVESPPAKKGKRTILVVDDSIVIRKMVEIALEEEDYLLQAAVSGKEGLDKLDSAKPDLVILDLMLPDINGIDILKAVKAGHKIPVIMLSGKDSPQMVEKAKAAGADAFLPKPFKDEELREQIKALITND